MKNRIEFKTIADLNIWFQRLYRKYKVGSEEEILERGMLEVINNKLDYYVYKDICADTLLDIRVEKVHKVFGFSVSVQVYEILEEFLLLDNPWTVEDIFIAGILSFYDKFNIKENNQEKIARVNLPEAECEIEYVRRNPDPIVPENENNSEITFSINSVKVVCENNQESIDFISKIITNIGGK
jgi:hypothetical protein